MNPPHPRMMIRWTSFKALIAALLVLSAWVPITQAGDQAKAILNGLDPKSMNELLELSKSQPDAALTNIAPVSANTFRFLFVWPASNPVMTYERVGRSFTERFLGFAGSLKLLATGFCLPSRNMYFGTATYGEEEMNVAYRDIQVRYEFGWQAPCAGRYVPISELEQNPVPAQSFGKYGTSSLPRTPVAPPKQPVTPEESLKPFLNPRPPIPSE